jgi:hypothetical protein
MDTKQGYIKLPRELLAQPIAAQPQRLALFVHLLLMANREAKTWRGVQIERGQVLTSLRSLSTSCGLSLSGVRTALEGLRREGVAHLSAHRATRPEGSESAHLSAHGYTLVTICNFDSYEGTTAEACTPIRTPKNAEPARPPARKAAPTKEDNIDILSIIQDPRFVDIVREWIEYKREKGQAYKGRKGITQFCNLLRQLSAGDPDTARRIVSEAMAANWGTIYEPKAPRRAAASPAARARTEIPEYDQNNFKSTLL